jgi:hypothetical protein
VKERHQADRRDSNRPLGVRDNEEVLTVVAAGAAGWLILLLLCAYAKARELRR